MQRYFIFFITIMLALFVISGTANSRGKSFKVEGVYQEASKQAQQLIENEDRYAERDNARQKSANSSANNNSSPSPSNSSQKSIVMWRCEFLCGKDVFNADVQGTDTDEARHNAVGFAEKNCWGLNHNFYKPMWGRTADCSKH